MNREQRRKAAKNPEVLDAMMHNAIGATKVEFRREQDKLIRRIVHEYSVVAVTVMHDRYGFGKKRLQEFIDHLIDLWDSIDREYVTVAELEDVLLEETGIKI